MASVTREQTDLTIQQMARRSGFSEPTLRYYEQIGLLGVVGRDESSGHRRYGPATVERVEALSCLRSAGMTVSGMRRYLDLLAEEIPPRPNSGTCSPRRRTSWPPISSSFNSAWPICAAKRTCGMPGSVGTQTPRSRQSPRSRT